MRGVETASEHARRVRTAHCDARCAPRPRATHLHHARHHGPQRKSGARFARRRAFGAAAAHAVSESGGLECRTRVTGAVLWVGPRKATRGEREREQGESATARRSEKLGGSPRERCAREGRRGDASVTRGAQARYLQTEAEQV